MNPSVTARVALPPLREDLRLHPGPILPGGMPTWLIEDPLRGRFFRIGWLEFELLSRWSLGDRQAVIDSVSEQTTLTPTIAEVDAVRDLLLQQALVRTATTAPPAPVRPVSLWRRILHGYLMFRVPLWRPDRALEALLPLARPLLGARAFWTSMLAGLAGLAFAAQRWEEFASTLVDTLNPQGLAGYLLALCVAKVIHEMAHALTAKSYGLQVPQMGVAFMVMVPMLYTDTSQSWRLPRRDHRFAIAAAGMRAELMLAAWCTLAWSLVPDGPLRGGLFFLATTSWMMTLLVNASPFMRFDGYYMLSDAAGIPNLHDAALEAARGVLRKALLDLPDPRPQAGGEALPSWIAAFGVFTIAYRAVVFLGIAAAVYHFFFKALGIFLFLVEIGWFIVRPLSSELRVWWRRRHQARSVRVAFSLGLLGSLLGVMVLPWHEQVHGEGWLRAAQEYAVYAPRAAQLIEVPSALGNAATQTDAQATLVQLQAADLGLRESQAIARIDALAARLQAGVGRDDAAVADRSTRQELTHQAVEAGATASEARRLTLSAPFAGQVVEVARELGPGAVVSPQTPLARVIDPSQWIGDAFVGEDDVKRLRVGMPARAYVDGIDGEVIPGTVIEIDPVPIDRMPHEMLSAAHGGRVPTVDNSLQPRRPLFRVRIALQGAPRVAQTRLAAFAIAGERRSLLSALWTSVAGFAVQQLSF